MAVTIDLDKVQSALLDLQILAKYFGEKSNSFNFSGSSNLVNFFQKIVHNYIDIANNINEVANYLIDYSNDFINLENIVCGFGGTISDSSIYHKASGCVNSIRHTELNYDRLFADVSLQHFTDTVLTLDSADLSEYNFSESKVQDILNKVSDGSLLSSLESKFSNDYLSKLYNLEITQYTVNISLLQEEFDQLKTLGEKDFKKAYEGAKNEALNNAYLKIDSGKIDLSVLGITEEEFHKMSKEELAELIISKDSDIGFEYQRLDKVLKENGFSSIEEYQAKLDSIEAELNEQKFAKMNLQNALKTLPYDLEMNTEDYQNFDFETSSFVDLDGLKKCITETENGVIVSYKDYCNEYGTVDPYSFLKKAQELYGKNVSVSFADKQLDPTLLRALSRVSDISPELADFYVYTYCTKGEMEANEYLINIEEKINNVIGMLDAQEFLSTLKDVEGDKIAYITNHFKVSVKGLGDGAEGFIFNTGYAFSAFMDGEDRVRSAREYEQMYILQAIASEQSKIDAGLISYSANGTAISSSDIIDFTKDYGAGLGINYQLSQSIGNMLPAIALSTVFQPLGTISLGVSAGGGAYHSAMVDGYSKRDAILYGITSGLNETLTEEIFGTLPFMSGENVFSLSSLFWSMVKEGAGEGLNSIVDGGILRTDILGESVTLGDLLMDAGISFGYGAATGFVMNLPRAIFNGYSMKKVNNDIQTGKVSEADIVLQVNELIPETKGMTFNEMLENYTGVIKNISNSLQSTGGVAISTGGSVSILKGVDEKINYIEALKERLYEDNAGLAELEQRLAMDMDTEIPDRLSTSMAYLADLNGILSSLGKGEVSPKVEVNLEATTSLDSLINERNTLLETDPRLQELMNAKNTGQAMAIPAELSEAYVKLTQLNYQIEHFNVDHADTVSTDVEVNLEATTSLDSLINERNTLLETDPRLQELMNAKNNGQAMAIPAELSESYVKLTQLNYQIEHFNVDHVDTVSTDVSNSSKFNNIKFSNPFDVIQNNISKYVEKLTKINEVKQTTFFFDLMNDINQKKNVQTVGDLKQSIIENMPDGLTDFEKARWLYLELGKQLNFDENLNSELMNYAEILQHHNQITDSSLINNNKVICLDWSHIYSDLLNTCGIENVVQSLGHKWVEFKIDGLTFMADATTGRLQDLARISQGESTEGFRAIFDFSEEGRNPIIDGESSFDLLLKDVDQNLGYIQTEYNNVLNNLNFEEGESVISKIQKFAETMHMNEVGFVEGKSYFLKFLDSLSETDRNLLSGTDISRIGADGTVETVNVTSVLQADGSYKFFAFSEGVGLAEVTVRDLDILFSNKFKLNPGKSIDGYKYSAVRSLRDNVLSKISPMAFGKNFLQNLSHKYTSELTYHLNADESVLVQEVKTVNQKKIDKLMSEYEDIIQSDPRFEGIIEAQKSNKKIYIPDDLLQSLYKLNQLQNKLEKLQQKEIFIANSNADINAQNFKSYVNGGIEAVTNALKVGKQVSKLTVGLTGLVGSTAAVISSPFVSLIGIPLSISYIFGGFGNTIHNSFLMTQNFDSKGKTMINTINGPREATLLAQNFLAFSDFFQSRFTSSKENFFLMRSVNALQYLEPNQSYGTISQIFTLNLLQQLEKLGYIKNLSSIDAETQSLFLERLQLGTKKRSKPIPMYEIYFETTDKTISPKDIDMLLSKARTGSKIDFNEYKFKMDKSGRMIFYVDIVDKIIKKYQNSFDANPQFMNTNMNLVSEVVFKGTQAIYGKAKNGIAKIKNIDYPSLLKNTGTFLVNTKKGQSIIQLFKSLYKNFKINSDSSLKSQIQYIEKANATQLDSFLSKSDILAPEILEALKNKIVKDNDILYWETSGYRLNSNILSFIESNPDVIQQLSNNSLIALTNSFSSQSDAFLNEIIRRIDSGDAVFNNISYDFTPMVKNDNNQAFSKLSKKYVNKIQNIQKLKVGLLPMELKSLVKSTNINWFNQSFLIEAFASGKIDNKGVELIQNLVSTNPRYMNSMNYNLLNESYINAFDADYFNKIICDTEISSKIEFLHDNYPNLFQAYVDIVNQSKFDDSLYVFYPKTQAVLNYMFNHSSSLSQMNSKLMASDNFVNYMIYEITNPQAIVHVDHFSSKFEQEFNKKCDEKFYETTDFDIKKEIFFEKYFSMNLKDVENLVYKYDTNIDEISNYDSISSEMLENLKYIFEIDNVDLLNEIYESQKFKFTAEEMFILEDNLRRAYGQTYVEQLSATSQNILDFVKNNPDSVMLYTRGEYQAQVINYDGDFSFLVKSTAAGLVKKTTSYDSFVEEWNASNPLTHILSTSFISNSNIGTAPIKDGGILYGFTDISPADVAMISPADMHSNIHDYGYTSLCKQKFITSSEMSSYTTRVYNEIALEKGDIKPNFVIIFDDSSPSIIDNSIKAASEWQIPVIKINKADLAKVQSDLIQQHMNDFIQTQDLSSLEKALNLYEANTSGYHMNLTNNALNSNLSSLFDSKKITEDIVHYIDSTKNPIQLDQLSDILKTIKYKYDLTDSISGADISTSKSTLDIQNLLNLVDKIRK